MLSEKQLLANRNNCLKSTGPRTPDGKRNASRNAIRHGLLSDSAEVLLKGENQDEFESFHQNLLTNLDPQVQLEVLLAERITGFFWKLKRAGRMEKGLLDILCNPSSDSDPSSKKSALPFVMIMTKTYDNPSKDPEYQEFKKLKEQQTVACGLDLSEGKIVDKESFASMQALQTPEKNPSPIADSSSAESLGKAVQHDFKSGSLLERLLRYEGQIERGLYRALTELQKFQFLRRRNDALSVDEASVLPNNSDISSVADDNPGSISVKSVVPVSSEAEKPNEPILQAPSASEGIEVLHNNIDIDVISESHVASATGGPSAVFNVGEASLLHNEKSNEAILQQADASSAQQMAADRPNADTGYFYHSPPCRSVSPQQYASHGATSLGHLSDEQLDRLSRQIV